MIAFEKAVDEAGKRLGNAEYDADMSGRFGGGSGFYDISFILSVIYDMDRYKVDKALEARKRYWYEKNFK
jgi:hypothetical protein